MVTAPAGEPLLPTRNRPTCYSIRLSRCLSQAANRAGIHRAGTISGRLEGSAAGRPGQGLAESWIIDRFQRTLTVMAYLPTGVQERVVRADESYPSPHLPGFEVPLAELLAAADQEAQAE